MVPTNSSSFWPDLLVEFSGTALGAAFGLWVGLYVERVAREKVAASEASRASQSMTERRNAILDVLRQILTQEKTSLEEAISAHTTAGLGPPVFAPQTHLVRGLVEQLVLDAQDLPVYAHLSEWLKAAAEAQDLVLRAHHPGSVPDAQCRERAASAMARAKSLTSVLLEHLRGMDPSEA